ncbi:MAG: glutamine synthetase [Pararhodobacter sp.]|nr:glutamine synthetase [Pararhodobacter sp.]
MTSEDIVYACTCDLAGKTRGKGFPAADMEKRLKRGIGWAPTNSQITCFDAIAPSPFGALGDRVLIPDPGTRVTLRAPDMGLSEDFVLGDLYTTDGQPWALCPRTILKTALERLKRVAGLSLQASFEHEFQFRGAGMGPGTGYALQAFRPNRLFAERLVAAMRAAGLKPDTIMKEYGTDQFEVTMDPAKGVTAADHAVILRQLVYAVADSCDQAATFTPLQDPAGIGNGVHIHFSFVDATGAPATYDPQGRHRLTAQASAFAAGVLRHVDEIMALLAPSVVSYGRLTPHRWSAAFNNLGIQDREATLRICPVSALSDIDIARQFNLEFRAADACASPYLQLAALVHAGCQGIEDALVAPDATEEDLAELSPEALKARGLRRLPASLDQALDAFSASDRVRDWFGAEFVQVYRLHKQGEIAYLADKSPEEMHRAYALVY